MAALNTDPLIPPVLDRAEPKPDLPYGTWGESSAVRRGALNNEVRGRLIVVIDWWGAAKVLDRIYGNSQIADAAARARALLDGNRLALTSGRVVSLRWDSDAYLNDPDPNLRHLAQRFRVGVVE